MAEDSNQHKQSLICQCFREMSNSTKVCLLKFGERDLPCSRPWKSVRNECFNWGLWKDASKATDKDVRINSFDFRASRIWSVWFSFSFFLILFFLFFFSEARLLCRLIFLFNLVYKGFGCPFCYLRRFVSTVTCDVCVVYWRFLNLHDYVVHTRCHWEVWLSSLL